MTRKLCFSVDVDRDVNECVPGRRDAVSLRSDGHRYTSSEAGTNVILEMLDEIGIKATFFAEAEALENIDVSFGSNEVAMHGLRHEDMTGLISGIPLSDDELDAIMGRSSEIIKDRTGKAPKGFRAPYMRTNDKIMNAAAKAGAVYDSSLYAPLGPVFRPYDLDNGMKEMPVPFTVDGNGKKMYAYLWPMHEGARRPEEFVSMGNAVNDGIFIIATHSWHITESRAYGMMDEAQVGKNTDNVRNVITSLLDSGFKAVRMSDLID
jgi:peptidoglycan/xylan/chitin deacetylase (PgdA/CDA1 family)